MPIQKVEYAMKFLIKYEMWKFNLTQFQNL